MSKRALVLLPVALVVAASAAVVLAERHGPASKRPELQQVLDELVAGSSPIAPGATAFVSGPKGTWTGSAGVSSLASKRFMRSDARMRLESVSKIYTAALVLRLAQQGKLRTSDTVERWLPGLLPYGHRITIRQLLTMRSGLIDNNDMVAAADLRAALANVRDAKLRAQMQSIAERVGEDENGTFDPIWWVRLAAWQPLLTEPGTTFHYSNIGYEILGLVAERAGGAPLATLYRRELFEPLGLRATAYDPQGPISGAHARGYAIGNLGTFEASDAHAGIGAEGGIVSSASDTAAFLVGLMQGKVLGQRWIDRMQGADLWEGGAPSTCAGAAYGWSGGGSGYKTNVWVNHDGSRVAVLFMNARHVGDAQAAADQTAGNALATLYCAA